jgi:hypothetical protein
MIRTTKQLEKEEEPNLVSFHVCCSSNSLQRDSDLISTKQWTGYIQSRYFRKPLFVSLEE